jgi:hypothetical protein
MQAAGPRLTFSSFYDLAPRVDYLRKVIDFGRLYIRDIRGKAPEKAHRAATAAILSMRQAFGDALGSLAKFCWTPLIEPSMRQKRLPLRLKRKGSDGPVLTHCQNF